MIGQKKNKDMIDKWCISKNVPQFIIIVGDKGSGKKLLSKYIADRLNLPKVDIGIKVENVREMIHFALTVPAVYCIADTDNMSTNAKNAMLKIVEEPPVDTYFIMTVSDPNSILDTLKSRARIITMETYTASELEEYKPGLAEMYYKTANSPGELDKLVEYGDEFFDYVELVLDNIREVESANAFKSGNKLALKSDEGYDVQLFFTTVISICFLRDKYPLLIALKTGEYLTKICRVGANKQQIYDMWVLDVRQICN